MIDNRRRFLIAATACLLALSLRGLCLKDVCRALAAQGEGESLDEAARGLEDRVGGALFLAATGAFLVAILELQPRRLNWTCAGPRPGRMPLR